MPKTIFGLKKEEIAEEFGKYIVSSFKTCNIYGFRGC
jgi:hypothetical protein